jgi:hypothetical protein
MTPDRSARVLLVEDETIVAMLFEDMLADLRYILFARAATLSRLNPTPPRNRCVRFVTTVASAHATLATKRALPLTWTGLPPAGSHQLAWCTHSITASARPRSESGKVTPRV